MAEHGENKNKTIMVVDDDDTVLSFLTFSLQGEGFRVIAYPDAERALKALATTAPDLILLDIMMPKMDGFSMCREVRTDPRLSKVPVIFITAFADQDSLAKTQSVGAQGLIEKPIMFDELLLQVLDALAGRFSLPTRLKYSL